MNKKIFENPDFCFQVPTLLVENLLIFLPILMHETTLPPCLALLTFQLSTSGFD